MVKTHITDKVAFVEWGRKHFAQLFLMSTLDKLIEKYGPDITLNDLDENLELKQ